LIAKAIRSIALFSVIFFGGILLSVFLSPVFGIDFNAYFGYRALRADPTGSVVVVSIDNRSLDALTQSDLKVLTFSKKIYIDLIEKLQAAGARAIGLDIVLANPDPDATRLVEVLDKYKNITLAAKVGNGSKDSEVVLPQAVYPQKYWSMIDVISRKNIVSELAPVAHLAWQPVEAFALRLYRLTTGDTTTLQGAFTVQKNWFLPQNYYSLSPIREIPLTEQSTVLIPFLRHRGEFPKISLIDVLAGKFPPDFFRNKTVLVGEYGTLIHDAQIAPSDLSTKMPGVEFHANMLESLLKNSPLRSVWAIPEFTLLVTFALIGFALTLRARLWQCLLWIVVSPVILFFVTLYAHAGQGVLLDVWYIFFAGIIAPVLGGWVYRYVALDAQRRFLTGAFSHYISPDVVAKIAENPESFTLWGERREMTVFFSDIAGFTNISEKLGTEKLFTLITEYLSEMTEILVRNNGTLDKYIGDAVMGFYGAPLPLERSSYWACKTALEQQSRLRDLNIKWQQQGIPLIHTRIGIHWGEAMVGNIGSRDRFNYTAMGDHVNLASRLEGVNKEYDTLICVSQSIASEVTDDFLLRKLDRIKVKGKDEGIDIYELVAFAQDATSEIAQKKLAITSYSQALECYFAGDFARARGIFRQHPEDGPASIMAARCVSLLAGTTELKDGVFVFSHK
jgi:class 3 adenylate cyclase/CHASE2 domain-containing sensor protein